MVDVNTTQMRDALAWVTQDQADADNPDKNIREWLWEAIQGDFSETRSTGQIAFDAAVSMIPIVDQVCDVRDLIANCRKINEKPSDTWAWVALCLTLIGLFPSLGSLVKGVLKIFFLFVRRSGGDGVIKVVESAMTWVITFLRKREVQKYIRNVIKADEIFKWLAEQIKVVKGWVNSRALLAAFDRGIKLMEGLLSKVTWLPSVGEKAQATIDLVKTVRNLADEQIGKAVKPVQDILDNIILALERRHLLERGGILDAHNIHFHGALPEANAVTLMRNTDPSPSWLTKPVKIEHKPLPERVIDLKPSIRQDIEMHLAEGWPSHGDLTRFEDIIADELKGPARLYRVVSPSNMASGDCWVTEAVFKRIQASPNPRAVWRKHLGVWPDWNVNGQFVIYDVKTGESLKVWRGTASTQTKFKAGLDASLEGGWEQIVFNAAKNPADTASMDTLVYYAADRVTGQLNKTDLTYPEYRALHPVEQSKYEALRSRINNDHISGPFDTGWGYTDFNEQVLSTRMGLPNLPGQITQLAH